MTDPDPSWNSFGPRLLAFGCCFLFLCVPLSSMSYFIFFWGLLGLILSSQANPPTLKNLDFRAEILTFMKKKLRFRSKDGFESVWGLSWAPFGSSWGSLGGSLGALHRPQRASRFIWELSWTSFARFWLLLLVYFRSSFFDVVFYLLSEPLGIDVALPSRPSDPQKP